jgi:D-alanine-D-alanine ligase-like ATP-grasp enzyme
MQIEEIARRVHSLLHLRDYSRTDMVVHPKRGIFVLEVNSLPEVSHRSSFIKSLEALGGNIKEFVSHLIKRVENRGR